MSRIKFIDKSGNPFNNDSMQYLVEVEHLKEDMPSFGIILRFGGSGAIKYDDDGNYSLTTDELQLIVDKMRELEAAHG